MPDTPAALCGAIRVGDRILAVNGKSIVGADYQRLGFPQFLLYLDGFIFLCITLGAFQSLKLVYSKTKKLFPENQANQVLDFRQNCICLRKLNVRAVGYLKANL